MMIRVQAAGAILLLSLALASCSTSSKPSATPTLTGPRASGPKSIAIVSSTLPAVLTSRRGTRVYHIVTHVSGVALFAQGIGRPPTNGQGHIQAYLDRLPADAFSRVDLGASFLFQVASPAVNFRLPPAIVHAKPGSHQILLALAKNNGVLYRGVRPAVVRFTLQ